MYEKFILSESDLNYILLNTIDEDELFDLFWRESFISYIEPDYKGCWKYDRKCSILEVCMWKSKYDKILWFLEKFPQTNLDIEFCAEYSSSWESKSFFSKLLYNMSIFEYEPNQKNKKSEKSKSNNGSRADSQKDSK